MRIAAIMIKKVIFVAHLVGHFLVYYIECVGVLKLKHNSINLNENVKMYLRKPYEQSNAISIRSVYYT